jgi:hypothetical protein
MSGHGIARVLVLSRTEYTELKDLIARGNRHVENVAADALQAAVLRDINAFRLPRAPHATDGSSVRGDA